MNQEKLQTLLSLEAKGRLPEKQKQALDGLRKKGVIPAPPAPSGGVFDSEGPGLVGTLGRSLADGLLFGFGDEAAAALQSAVTGRPYDETYEAEDAATEKAYEKRPGLSFAGQLAGGIATGGTGAAKVLGSQAVRQAPRLVRWAAYPAVGAAEGAVAGAGYADPGKRDEGAVMGGATGAAVGAAIPAAGAAVRKAVIDPIRAATGRGSAKVGSEYVRRALDRQKMTPEQAVKAVREMGEDATLVDTGKNAAALGEYVAQRPGRGMEIASDFMEGRRASQAGRILDRFKAAVLPAGKDLVEEGGESFGGTLKARVPVTEGMLKVLNRPAMRKAWNRARELAAERDEALPAFDDFMEMAGRKFQRSGSRAVSTAADGVRGAGKPSIEDVEVRLLHWLKKGLDDVLEPKRDPVTGKVVSDTGRNLLEAQKATRAQFRQIVKDLAPDYGKALDKLSREFRMDDAVNLGRKAFRPSMKPGAIKKQIGRLSPAERRAFQQGFIESLEDTINKPAALGYDVSRYGLHPDKLKAVFGGKADDIIDALKKERGFAQTENRIGANSATARRLQIKEDFEGGMMDPVGYGMDAATGNKLGLVGRIGRDIYSVARRPPKKAADEAARILFESDPEKLARILQQKNLPAAASPSSLADALMGGSAVVSAR